MRAIFIFFLVVKSITASSQSLPIDTILNLYKRDSSGFKSYFEQKNYLTINRSGNIHTTIISYTLRDSSTITRCYTDGTTVQIPNILYNSFSSMEFKYFKNVLKRNGYVLLNNYKHDFTKDSYALIEDYLKDSIGVKMQTIVSPGRLEYSLLMYNALAE